MKQKFTITEFSKFTGVNKETIRFYREAGLLNPEQDPKNNYFYYTMSDAISLFFLRKQRNIDIPLSTIKDEYTMRSFNYEWITERLDNAIKEREHLDRQIRWLTNAKMYYDTTFKNITEVIEEDFAATKFDFSLSENASKITHDLDAFSSSLCISKKDLLSDEDVVPIENNLGILEHSVDMIEDFVLPKNHLVFPAGTYISLIVEIDDFEKINRSKLQPLLDYAQAHHYTIVSGTTSSLLQIHRNRYNCLKFYYRIRVRIEKAGD